MSPTHTELRYELRGVQGVGVLMLWLRGSVSRYDDEVGVLSTALEETAIALGDAVEVAVLNVLEFSNADGDEAAGVKVALHPIPCCWVSYEWDEQDEALSRWDLPASEWLASTEEGAITRVVELRRQGLVTWRGRDGVIYTRGRWTERGFETRDTRRGLMTTLYRGLLAVERVIEEADATTRVLWPVRDRLGAESEAVRRRARLVYVDDRLMEIDFSRFHTRRAAAPGWIDAVLDVPSPRAPRPHGRAGDRRAVARDPGEMPAAALA